MLAAQKATASPCFELKSAALTLVAVVLRTTDLAQIALALEERFGAAPELFDNDPVAIDLSLVPDAPVEFGPLIELLRRYKMQPIAARGGQAEQMEDARAAGLVEAQGPAAPAARAQAPHPPHPRETAPVVVQAMPQALPEPGPPAAARSTLIVDKPLRSGQRVYAKGADLIVLAVVSYGAEVVADGDIHVYAPLRGRAAAGALGDTTARIFSTCMEPQLLSIAGIYRTTDTALSATVVGKAAQAWLDGESLVVAALSG